MNLPINIINRIFEYLANLNNSPKLIHFSEIDETVSLKIHPHSSIYHFLHQINNFKHANPPIQHTATFHHDFRTQVFTNPIIDVAPTPISVFVLPKYSVWDEFCTPVCIQFEMLNNTYAYMNYTQKQNPNWGTDVLFVNGCLAQNGLNSLIPSIPNPDFSYISGMQTNMCQNLEIELFSFLKKQNRELTTAVFKEYGVWIFSNRLNKWVWVNNDGLEMDL